MSTMLSLTVAALLAAGPSPDSSARFALSGSLTLVPTQTIDGRFGIQASARIAAADASTGERFQLKSTQGLICATGDNLFQNGLE